MQETMTMAEKEEIERERFALACDRIAQIPSDTECGVSQTYFN